MLKLRLSTGILALVTFPFSALGQLEDPIPGTIEFSNIVLNIEEFAQIPESASSSPRARINHLKPAGDGSGRVFVNDLRGKLHLIVNDTVSTYLDLDNELPDFTDSPGFGTGFTSFAFDPEFGVNGKLFTAHMEPAGTAVADFSPPISQSGTSLQGVLTEWTATDPASNIFSGTHREILRVDLVRTSHGFQEIAFNPNSISGDPDFGKLYICIGDSGTTLYGYPDNTQRLDSVLGSVLRIDTRGTNSVNGNYGIPDDNPWASDGDPNTFGEIWVYGFRNPHRISWDTGGSGIMLLGDIGEKRIEELNLIEPGRNYGWNAREGTFVITENFNNSNREDIFPLPADDDQFGYTYPVAQYDRDPDVDAAIVSGYAYRGTLAPVLEGKFIFGDIVDGRLFFVEVDSIEQGTQSEIKTLELQLDGQRTSLLEIVDNDRADLRFGYDEDNELYLLEKVHGMVYKITGAEDTGAVDPQEGVGTQFVNIATRGLVGANPGEELIGGFVLLGSNPQELLIRGLGPDLTDRGVPGALADPVIEVRNFVGQVVASGDDWGDEANADEIAAAIAALSADSNSALAEGSTDAAILVTLPPNEVYTVIVSGKGEAGVALVEVFEKDG